jgi:Cys-tRNA(Pro) deacylase
LLLADGSGDENAAKFAEQSCDMCNDRGVHRNVQRVQQQAEALGLAIEIRTFAEPTRTAEEAATAIGVGVGQIVKSLVFAVGDTSSQPGEIVVALVSGSNQLDEKKLARAAGAKKAWRIDATQVLEATGYVIGGIPPFGHSLALRTFADTDLLQYEVVWAAAGTSNHNFSSNPAQLCELTGAALSDLAKARTS